ncbi:TetR/AcrR family transcriptional regulator [Frankia nepalensis]|nr:TetR/AcrR family transcriptional regulator [Frankia nepalensis]
MAEGDALAAGRPHPRGEQAGPGRPRDTRRHAAVLAATRDLLARGGYTALTFSDVAERAGVTRQLVHRWWPDRPALVAEALFTAPAAADWPTAYEGPLAADLRRLLSAMVDYACRPEVRAGVLGLMADAVPSAELTNLEDGLLGPLRRSLGALVDAAVARGEARDEIDVGLTLNTLRGAVLMHLIADLTPPEVIVDHLTSLTLWAFRRDPEAPPRG